MSGSPIFSEQFGPDDLEVRQPRLGNLVSGDPIRYGLAVLHVAQTRHFGRTADRLDNLGNIDLMLHSRM